MQITSGNLQASCLVSGGLEWDTKVSAGNSLAFLVTQSQQGRVFVAR